MASANTFGKHERITSDSAIQELFKKGQSGFSFPIKYLIRNDKSEIGSVKILITVPKRSFKKAVDRNHLKRLIREAYRCYKHPLTDLAKAKKLAIEIAFIYVVKEKVDFAQVETGMAKIIQNISYVIQKG